MADNATVHAEGLQVVVDPLPDATIHADGLQVVGGALPVADVQVMGIQVAMSFDAAAPGGTAGYRMFLVM